jgi:cyclic pyranopterin phosphate synthase
MPSEGVPWAPDETVLGAQEILRLVRVAVRLGVRSVRLTGGEPLLRRDVVDIVSGLAGLSPRPELSLTTNGTRLAQLASRLAGAGLDRVNVSLDTLRPAVFAQITRRRGHGRVLAGLEAARGAGLAPVKVNVVLLRGVNDDEACDLLAFCLEHGYQCRFIEQMPLDAGHCWSRSQMVTADEILEQLSRRFSLSPLEGRGSAPAQLFGVDGGGGGTVGIVAAVTRPFCAGCNRLRLTADGQLRNCLFARDETDLRALLRAGADDETLAGAMARTVRLKAAGHGIDDPGFLQPARPMSAIGG